MKRKDSGREKKAIPLRHGRIGLLGRSARQRHHSRLQPQAPSAAARSPLPPVVPASLRPTSSFPSLVLLLLPTCRADMDTTAHPTPVANGRRRSLDLLRPCPTPSGLCSRPWLIQSRRPSVPTPERVGHVLLRHRRTPSSSPLPRTGCSRPPPPRSDAIGPACLGQLRRPPSRAPRPPAAESPAGRPTDRYWGCPEIARDERGYDRIPRTDETLETGPSEAATLAWAVWPVSPSGRPLRAIYTIRDPPAEPHPSANPKTTAAAAALLSSRFVVFVFAREMMPEVEFERGARSTHDADKWKCICKVENHPKQCFVFDIPKFFCQCGRKFDGDFDYCLGDVRVNKLLLLEKVLEQQGDSCVATGMCQTLHIMHAVDSVRKGQRTDPFKMNLDPLNLEDEYECLFPSKDQLAHRLKGVHKVINMSLILKNKGMKLNNGELYKIGDVGTIPGDNFEAMCEEIANGVPLMTSFHPGVTFYEGLGYCQVYRAPFLHKVMEKAETESVGSHFIVLIGAFSMGGIRGFYFLNSHGELFCLRIVDEDPQVMQPAVKGGIGKIQEKFNYMNAIKFFREGEEDGDGYKVERFHQEPNPEAVSNENIMVLCGQLAHRVCLCEIAQVEEEEEEEQLAQEEEQQLPREEERLAQ